jgi:hypothetical protein
MSQILHFRNRHLLAQIRPIRHFILSASWQHLLYSKFYGYIKRHIYGFPIHHSRGPIGHGEDHPNGFFAKPWTTSHAFYDTQIADLSLLIYNKRGVHHSLNICLTLHYRVMYVLGDKHQHFLLPPWKFRLFFGKGEDLCILLLFLISG